MSIWTRAFWKATAERAIATASQAAILTFGGDLFFNAIEADWATVGGAAAGGAILAVLKALAAWQFNIGTGNGPSWGNERVVVERPR